MKKINMMSYNYKINKSTTVKPYWKLYHFILKMFSQWDAPCELIPLRTHQGVLIILSVFLSFIFSPFFHSVLEEFVPIFVKINNQKNTHTHTHITWNSLLLYLKIKTVRC